LPASARIACHCAACAWELLLADPEAFWQLVVKVAPDVTLG
jgi:hypothetical protein